MNSLLIRDFRLIWRKPAEILNLLIFYFLLCFIISFSIPEESKNLMVGYSVIIISLILTFMLSKDWVFERDLRLGILQQIYLNSNNYTIIMAKIASSFLFFCLPISLISPVSCLFFGINEEHLLPILAGTLCTSLIISVLNTFFAAMTIGVRNGGILSVILSIPLYITMVVINISYVSSLADDRYEALQNMLLNSGSMLMITLPMALIFGNISLSIASEDY